MCMSLETSRGRAHCINRTVLLTEVYPVYTDSDALNEQHSMVLLNWIVLSHTCFLSFLTFLVLTPTQIALFPYLSTSVPHSSVLRQSGPSP
jgi:hypothetical protein